MSRGGAILPATQGFYRDRTTKRAGLLPVKPEAEAFFTEHMLAHQDQRFPEFCLANGTDVTCLSALLAGGTNSIGLWGAEDLQCLPDTSQTTTDVKRLAEAVQDNQDPTKEVAAGWIISHDVFIP